MFSRNFLLALGLALLLLSSSRLRAAEPPPDRNTTKLPSSPAGLFGVSGMAQAAVDLRHSGEAFERFAKLLAGVAESTSQSLATMSSEFDPFGFKTGHRTISKQNEMLQAQREMILTLQQREIDRLQRENNKLAKRLKKRRKKASR